MSCFFISKSIEISTNLYKYGQIWKGPPEAGIIFITQIKIWIKFVRGLIDDFRTMDWVEVWDNLKYSIRSLEYFLNRD